MNAPLTAGDFEALPKAHTSLKWKDLSGTEGRYSVAFSLSLGDLYAPEKSLLAQVKEVDQKWSLTCHFRQNFWLKDETTAGIRVQIYYCMLGPDESIIISESGPYSMIYDETEKHSWRLWSAPKLSHF
jgi:hypothetical protein